MSTTIPVPQQLVAAAMGGQIGALKEVREAQAALEAARQKALVNLNPDVAQALAEGIARTNGITSPTRMTISLEGDLVVEVIGGATQAPVQFVKREPKVKRDPSAGPNPVNPNGLTGPAAYPPIHELRARAQAVGVDLSQFAPQNKRGILAAIEAAEQVRGAVPANVTATKAVVAPTAPVVAPTTEDDDDFLAD